MPPKGRVPEPEEQTRVRVPLFRSAHNGYGDSIEVQDFRYNRIHGSVDARWPGQIRAGLRVEKKATTWDRVPVFATEWTDSNGINPMIYIIVDDEVWGLRFGSLIEAEESASKNVLSAISTTAMFHDDGSGIPLIYVGYGTGTDIDSVTRFIPSSGETTTATGGSVKADKLYSLNGRAYRSITPSGGAANCQISTLPIGANPLTSANWGAGQLVGWASTNVNAITAVRHLPIVIKPEGIFMYDENLDRWVNQTRGWTNFIHLDNGKGAFSLGEQAVIPLGDGGAVIFDGFNIKEFDPSGFNSSPNLHTTTSSIDSLGTMKYWIMGATSPKTKESAIGTRITVFHFDDTGSSYTDLTSNLRGADLTTSVTFTIDENDDFIYIGFPHPFVAVAWDLTGVNNNAATVTTAIATSGSGDPPTFSTISASSDFTDIGGAPMAQSGRIVLTSDPVAAGWITGTVNGVTNTYWLRLNWNVALDDITAVNLRLQPWFPSVDPTNFPLDGLDKSGIYPHIIAGTKDREVNTWHDMFTLDVPDEIGAVLYGNVGGTSVNRSRALLAIGRKRIFTIDVAATDHPGTEIQPFINQYALIEAPSLVPAPGHLARLTHIYINGLATDSSLGLLGRFYYTWDDGNPWTHIGTVSQFPADFEVNQPQKGYRFRWAWGWSQAGNVAQFDQPAVTSLEAEFEVLPDALDSIQSKARKTEPRF